MTSPYYATQGPVVVQGQAVSGVAVPTYNNNYQEVQKGQVQPKRCNDVLFAILFYGHLAVIGFITGAYAPQMYSNVANEYGGRELNDNNNNNYEENDNNGEEGFGMTMSEVYMILGISGFVGFVMSTLALTFMMTFAAALIKTALIFNLILSGVMAVMAVLAGALPVALLCLVGFALTACYAYTVWSRIPYAAANMVTAITAVKANMGVSFYAYLNLFLTFGWTLWWSLAFVATNYVVNGCSAQGECDTNPSGGVVFLFLVSYFWVIQVVKNVVHVTVAGTVGTWWFYPQEANTCCSKAVTSSWVRSMTYSFGSICFGSLIVAIIQALKELCHQMRQQDDNVLACLAECILGCIESLVEYFNQWAFVYVGLYGYSFIDAGKNVMTLFRSRGWTSIIADQLVDSVLNMVSIGVGVLTGIIGIIAAKGAGIDMSGGNMMAPFFLGFLFGFALCATLFSVVSSAVNTVIVCYAEAPAEFQQNHPQLAAEMQAAWKQAWPNDFSY
mmetsp:Transcript_5360/g.6247  ORF Transcript_5360/g.6247 Transcript_5360/m.6247 type:complete len:501 (+) Transcript_5360:287-1789(+)|eukprot:CAMPEP_0194155714 /NCGR_PEP_ID=MMETSP0152-20130528/65632_1 /TAXON_ID=1049557 /ORGANISM="Thalassiothrix antarctica, Strain L6-D1" /LENGTH=500 /DNA_ID=CAMNT_0038862825 /DNA_START=283 /DNA_END=1785 /DNA_ORIENTATION=-